MDSQITKLAILGGSGILPRVIYNECLKLNIDCIVIGIEGDISHEAFNGVQYNVQPIYAVSKILNILKIAEIKDLVLVGKVTRKNLSKLAFDIKGIKLLTTLWGQCKFSNLNDCDAINAVVKFLESEGLHIIPIDNIVKDILVKKGIITHLNMNTEALFDIDRGASILRSLSKSNSSIQSLVIQHGLVLGIESKGGTDELIKRCGQIQQKSSNAPGILIKLRRSYKCNQLDSPCIGPNTILNLYKYKLQGVAIESDHSIILDPNETVALANELGIFIYGI